MNTRALVQEKFSEPVRCYGHCQQQATMRIIKDEGGEVMTVIACPSGYVSRFIGYGDKKIDQAKFKAFVSSVTTGLSEVKDQDIRTATRYPWDLNYDPKLGDFLNVVFWTQNYRGNKSEDPNRKALFICNKCSSLYTDLFTGSGGLCPNCR